MISGMFVESHTGQNVLVTLKMYAHRSLPQLMVTELLVRNDQDVPLRVDLGSEVQRLRHQDTQGSPTGYSHQKRQH